MKIAIFAAVPDEVGTMAGKVHFTGIGRENATRSMIRFMNRHKDEDFTILNIGSVGSHDRPVGSILRIREIVSSGSAFYAEKMWPDLWELKADAAALPGTLFSSDSFVSPEVYTEKFLDAIKLKVDCFDMESSALFSIAQEYGKKYVSYKIVSDNLDVTIEVWKARVNELSKKIVAHIQNVMTELAEKEPIEFL